ncbi:hypothetical protein JW752_04365 [Candidatus Peregrinibacteria bacterium]|nr:hypothetical protein [Candidatus Peregrinibacteria bacterium]
MVFGRPAFQVPGESVAHAAADDQVGEISLVSLAFPRLDGCTDVIATDRLTDQLIGVQWVDTDDWTVVTLRLFRNEIASPHLQFLGTEGASFKADIQPRHAVETYRDLVVDRPTVVLKDFGVERSLEADGEVEIPPGEFTELWLGTYFGTAARARFVNSGEAGNFLLEWPEDCQAWTQRGGRLLPTSSAIGLGSDESFGFIVAPTCTLAPVSISIGLERSE